MSDNDKNDTKDVSKSELHIREGDIVWYTEAECVCEVISLQPQLKPKPGIYMTRLAGKGHYSMESTPDEVELLLSKEQIQYEEVISDTIIKAFYKGKIILNLVFISKATCQITYHIMNTIKRNYIFIQLLEMYPDTKISKTIINAWY